MAYQGMMDGWHGDEMECRGHCGLCEDCERLDDLKAEEAYEQWRDEDIVNQPENI